MTTGDVVSGNGSAPDGQFTTQLSGIDLQLQTKEDADQVRGAFTALIADLEPLCVQQEEALRAALGEIEDLKRQLARQRSARRSATEEEQEQAVELLTQAQAFADRLVGEAQLESRDMMLAARALQRKVVQEQRAVEERAAALASAEIGTEAEELGSDGERRVRSLAKMAKTQFYAVLDSLREEIDHLDDGADAAPPSVDTEMRQALPAGERPPRLSVAEPRSAAR